MANQQPRGVILDGPEMDAKPAEVPMDHIIVVRRFTRDGRLSPQGPGGAPQPRVAGSIEEVLQQAGLHHRFIAEIDGEAFVEDRHFESIKDFDPEHIERGSAETAGFARLAGRRSDLADLEAFLDQRPAVAGELTDAGNGELVADLLEGIARLVRNP